MAGAQGWLDPRNLLSFTDTRVSADVPDLFPLPRDGRRLGIQRRANRTWPGGGFRHAVHGPKRVLVPVVPELAERVPRDPGHGRAIDFPQAPRVGGIETGERFASRQRVRARFASTNRGR